MKASAWPDAIRSTGTPNARPRTATVTGDTARTAKGHSMTKGTRQDNAYDAMAPRVGNAPNGSVKHGKPDRGLIVHPPMWTPTTVGILLWMTTP